MFEYNDNIDARWSSGENRNGVKGESKENQQVYQKQVAATVSLLLGMQFTANHRIGQPLTVLPPTQKEEVGEATSAIISR